MATGRLYRDGEGNIVEAGDPTAKTLFKARGGPDFTITERLYKDKDGNVVKAGDESAVSLYKSPGAVIPLEEAEELGLTGGRGRRRGGAPVDG